MKHPFLNLAGVALLAAGMALGQGPAQKPPRMGPHAGQARQGTMVDRLATELNLTADRKHDEQVAERTRPTMIRRRSADRTADQQVAPE